MADLHRRLVLKSSLAAVGHRGLYRDANRDYIVYHAYDAENKAEPTLRISELIRDRDGWPGIQG